MKYRGWFLVIVFSILLASIVSAQIITNLEVVDETLDSFRLVFNTTEDSTCEVTGDLSTKISELGTSHNFEYTGLTHDTTYSFNVSCKGVLSSPTRSIDGTTLKAIIVREVNVGSKSASGTVISWKTDSATNSIVKYGLDELLGSQTKSDSKVYDHAIVLSGLEVGKKYYFRVESDGVSSPISEFTTKLEENPPSFVNGSIKIPQLIGEKVNRESIIISGKINEEGFIASYVNGVNSGNVSTLNDGSFNFNSITGWDISKANELKLVPFDNSYNEGIPYVKLLDFDVEEPYLNIFDVPLKAETSSLTLRGEVNEPGVLSVTVAPSDLQSGVSLVATEINIVSQAAGNVITWSNVTGARDYVVERDGQCLFTTSSGRTFVDRSVISGTSYTYEVYARDPLCVQGAKTSLTLNASYSGPSTVVSNPGCKCDPGKVKRIDVSGTSFSSVVDLYEGTNNIAVRYTDRNGLDSFQSFTVLSDTFDPGYKWVNLDNISEWYSEKFRIEGELTEDSEVKVIVNGKNYSASVRDGLFFADVDTQSGRVSNHETYGKVVDNEIYLIFTDNFGREKKFGPWKLTYKEFNIPEFLEVRIKATPQSFFEENLIKGFARGGFLVGLVVTDSDYTVSDYSVSVMRVRDTNERDNFQEEFVKNKPVCKTKSGLSKNCIIQFNAIEEDLIKGKNVLNIPLALEVKFTGIGIEDEVRITVRDVLVLGIDHNENQSKPSYKANKHLERVDKKLDEIDGMHEIFDKLSKSYSTMCIFDQASLKASTARATSVCAAANKAVKASAKIADTLETNRKAAAKVQSLPGLLPKSCVGIDKPGALPKTADSKLKTSKTSTNVETISKPTQPISVTPASCCQIDPKSNELGLANKPTCASALKVWETESDVYVESLKAAKKAVDNCESARQKLIPAYAKFTNSCYRVGSYCGQPVPSKSSYISNPDQYWTDWHPQLNLMDELPDYTKFNVPQGYEQHFKDGIRDDSMCAANQFYGGSKSGSGLLGMIPGLDLFGGGSASGGGPYSANSFTDIEVSTSTDVLDDEKDCSDAGTPKNEFNFLFGKHCLAVPDPYSSGGSLGSIFASQGVMGNSGGNSNSGQFSTGQYSNLGGTGSMQNMINPAQGLTQSLSCGCWTSVASIYEMMKSEMQQVKKCYKRATQNATTPEQLTRCKQMEAEVYCRYMAENIKGQLAGAALQQFDGAGGQFKQWTSVASVWDDNTASNMNGMYGQDGMWAQECKDNYVKDIEIVGGNNGKPSVPDEVKKADVQFSPTVRNLKGSVVQGEGAEFNYDWSFRISTGTSPIEYEIIANQCQPYSSKSIGSGDLVSKLGEKEESGKVTLNRRCKQLTLKIVYDDDSSSKEIVKSISIG